MKKGALLLAVLMCLGASATASSASTASAVAPRITGKSVVSEKAAARAVNYWTPRRMANAVPLDLGVIPGGPEPAVEPATERYGYTGGDAVSKAIAEAAAVTPRQDYWRQSTTAMPVRAIGRIYMRAWDYSRQQWYNSSCSGTVVAAENKSTVWTAGHCLYDTYGNFYNRNIAFCPAYRDSDGRPEWEYEDCQLGVWAVKYRTVPPEWRNNICTSSGCTNAEYQSDFGAMTLRPYGSTLIQNHTGSHILRYGVNTGAHYSFGYPAEAPYDGRWLYYCYADIFADHGHLMIECGATGGHSGGPWLGPWNSTTGRSYLDSVNSHAYRPGQTGYGWMHGPKQGVIAERLYDLMRNQNPY